MFLEEVLKYFDSWSKSISQVCQEIAVRKYRVSQLNEVLHTLEKGYSRGAIAIAATSYRLPLIWIVPILKYQTLKYL